MIDLDEQSLSIVKQILSENLPNIPVWAFGSRVTGGAKKNSDLDLVIKGKQKLDWQIIESIKDKFSDSMIPICIDLIDWHTLDESFKQIILNNYEVIK